MLGYQAAQLSMGFPPTWRATLAPILWLVPLWAAGLCVMFAASTLTIERPQHARWHQSIAAVVVASALLAILARGGIGDPAGIVAFLTQARLPRALGASAFVFATLLGGFVNPLLPGRALIWAALLTFSAVWFNGDGMTLLLPGGSAVAAPDGAPAEPFGGPQRAAVLYVIGLAAAWTPLLVWTSFKRRRDDE